MHDLPGIREIFFGKFFAPYGSYQVDILPPIPDMQELDILDQIRLRHFEDTSVKLKNINTGHFSLILQEAKQLNLELPSFFVACMTNIELLEKIPDFTQTYFGCFDGIIRTDDDCFIISFLSDFQYELSWYLHLNKQMKNLTEKLTF